jgi:hypothetical protein
LDDPLQPGVLVGVEQLAAFLSLPTASVAIPPQDFVAGNGQWLQSIPASGFCLPTTGHITKE